MSAENTPRNFSDYVDKIEKLPTLPLVAMQVFRKMSNPEFDMKDVVNLIMMDQVLTAKILRMVNSAYWGAGRSIESVRQAIVCLGAKNIRNLVLATSMMQMVPGTGKAVLLKSFWEHSLACAFLSGFLAKNVGYPDTEKAYLAGLLHDIGEIILLMNFPDEFDRVIEEAKNTYWDFNEAEKSILGISHVNFGPWLLEQWNMFGEIAHVVSRHHDPDTAMTEPTLVAVVNAVDMYTRTQGIAIGDPVDIGLDLVNQSAWNIIQSESKNDNGFDPIEKIELLDSQLENARELISMAYN